jgi:peptide chain release factor 2
MVFLENLKSELEALRPIISELHDVYDIERSQERIAELHEKAAEPNFWDDMEKSQKVLQETRNLEGKLEKYNKFKSSFEISKCLLKWQPMRVTKT